MAHATPKRCRQAGCGKTTTERHGYCDTHADQASWGKFQQQQRRKGPRVYTTKKWQETRDHVSALAKCLCINCLTKPQRVVKSGSVCEHIVPVAKGGTEQLTNLSFFCNSCAKTKTGWERTRTVDEILKRYGHTAINLHL
ncbi:HNH endonuclease [Pseudoalteromonas rhizosphaerae]|uniref:HNH endonuclease n=1 Tax=Pseudoalteromonas rhizosphaerae TaxID=2518973 RepID=UPI00384FA371